MKKKIIISKLPILFKFILYISFIEIIVFFFLKLIGLQVFNMIPYLRLASLFFTFIFFYNRIFYNQNLLKISLKRNSENVLVLLWIIFTSIGFFIGILHRNPILYLTTDVMYICFGYILFRIFSSDEKLLNDLKQDLSLKQEAFFIKSSVILSIFAFVLSVDLPSFLVVFSLAYSLFLYNKKEHKLMFYCLIPFFLQLLTSNRALLIVFFLMIFFSFAQNRLSKRNLKTLLLLSVFLLIFSFFFLDDILKFIINYLPEKSTLKDRLAQIYLMLSKGKINWSSPAMLSLSQRIDEAKLVTVNWVSNPFNFLFGGGMGATIEGFAFKDEGVTNSALLGKSAIHNIHLLPFSLLFRYGLFGVIIFLLLIYNLLKYFFIIILSENSLIKTLIIFQFSWILYSIPAASYLWTCPLFWITLAYISNERKIKRS